MYYEFYKSITKRKGNYMKVNNYIGQTRFGSDKAVLVIGSARKASEHSHEGAIYYAQIIEKRFKHYSGPFTCHQIKGDELKLLIEQEGKNIKNHVKGTFIMNPQEIKKLYVGYLLLKSDKPLSKMLDLIMNTRNAKLRENALKTIKPLMKCFIGISHV
jgi:hypothetical protein